MINKNNIITINNKNSMRYAFYHMSKKTGISYSEELFEQWLDFNNNYWPNLENFNIALPEDTHTEQVKRVCIEANRFQVFFKDYNISFKTALYMNYIYKNTLNKNVTQANKKPKILSLKNVI